MVKAAAKVKWSSYGLVAAKAVLSRVLPKSNGHRHRHRHRHRNCQAHVFKQRRHNVAANKCQARGSVAKANRFSLVVDLCVQVFTSQKVPLHNVAKM